MATSTIGTTAPSVIIEQYTASYDNTVKGVKNLSASAFGITAKPGYTIGAVLRWYSGDSGEDVAQVHPRTSGTVMTIKDSTQSAVSDKTAYIRIMWIRDDLVRDETVT